MKGLWLEDRNLLYVLYSPLLLVTAYTQILMLAYIAPYEDEIVQEYTEKRFYFPKSESKVLWLISIVVYLCQKVFRKV